MAELNNIEREKKKGSRLNLYHYYYKRKGVYSFFLRNLVKLILGLSALVVIILVLREFAPNLESQFNTMLDQFNPVLTIILFFLSESLLGLIPPDLFIIWSQKFSFPYLMVGFLGLISYLGGVVSYFIGKYISNVPKVEAWIKKKFSNQLLKIRKWGGILIIFAALFPLPFSSVCIVAGLVHFPFSNFLVLSLFRFLRFFGYALVLFKVF